MYLWREMYSMSTYSSAILFSSTPVFLPEKFHEQRNLWGCSLWGCKESGMTEQLSTHKWEPDMEFNGQKSLGIAWWTRLSYGRGHPVHKWKLLSRSCLVLPCGNMGQCCQIFGFSWLSTLHTHTHTHMYTHTHKPETQFVFHMKSANCKIFQASLKVSTGFFSAHSLPICNICLSIHDENSAGPERLLVGPTIVIFHFHIHE